MPTISIPIQIPDVITPVKVEDLPSKDVQFVTENLSAKEIMKVIRRRYTRYACTIGVYYTKTRARFLVNVKMDKGLITVSDFVSIFAETEPVAVITPAVAIIPKDEVEINLKGCERFKRIIVNGEEQGMGKVVYLKGSEQLRHAS
ncbi:MAG TPA: hypothetical protein VIM31_02105 [Candidatus Microsaccharimonas sp.]